MIHFIFKLLGKCPEEHYVECRCELAVGGMWHGKHHL